MSSHTSLFVSTITTVTALATLACSDGGAEWNEIDAELPPPVASLERLDYFADEPLLNCSEAPERAQEELMQLEDLLGVLGPERIAYVFHEQEFWDDNHPCPPNATGCAHGALVHSREYVHRHEIVHATLANEARPGLLLREGIATAFGHNAVRLPEKTPPLWDYVGASDHYRAKDLYGSGALFMAYLYRRYGGERLMHFYRQSHEGISREAFSATFTAVFDAQPEEAWEKAHQEGAPYVCEGIDDNTVVNPKQRQFNDDTCARDGLSNQHVWTLSTEDGDADSKPHRTASHQKKDGQPSSGTTGLAIQTNYYGSSLYTCVPGGPSTTLYGTAAGAESLFVTGAPAGRYILSRRASGELTTQEEYATVHSGDFVANHCEASEPFSLPPTTDILRLELMEGQTVGLEWQGEAPLTFQVFEGDLAHARFRLCSDCDDESSCRTLSADDTFVLEPGTTWISVKSTKGKDHDERFRLGAVKGRVASSVPEEDAPIE